MRPLSIPIGEDPMGHLPGDPKWAAGQHSPGRRLAPKFGKSAAAASTDPSFLFPATLLLAVAGGWLLTLRALQPVDAMAQVARRITAGDLSCRIPVHAGQDELSRLAETFNAMIAQLEESIQRLRQFSADASHELRTL